VRLRVRLRNEERRGIKVMGCKRDGEKGRIRN
jgi:hypothetical protein